MSQLSYDQLLAAEAARRETTDYRFDWGTYIGWTILTFGIYAHYATYRLVQRRQEHIRRRLAVQSYLWHTLNQRAESLGRRAEVAGGLDNLSRVHAEMEAFERRNMREPILWTILRLVFGIVGGYINHFLNKDLRFYDQWESAYFANAEWVMTRLGYPVSVPQRRSPVPDRSTAAYCVLSVITFGLFTIWWRYAMMMDGNGHFEDDLAMEDAILRGLGVPLPSAFGLTPPPPQPPRPAGV
ncbi:MAG: hypothetical protein HY775_01830 [Acidobacteria bacterium]|nr:hypothetical protein [Acidobacteriota bacterium]